MGLYSKVPSISLQVGPKPPSPSDQHQWELPYFSFKGVLMSKEAANTPNWTELKNTWAVRTEELIKSLLTSKTNTKLTLKRTQSLSLQTTTIFDFFSPRTQSPHRPRSPNISPSGTFTTNGVKWKGLDTGGTAEVEVGNTRWDKPC